MIRIAPFGLFLLLLTGCASLGTKTLYRSNTKPAISRVGYANLDGEAIVTKLFPQTNKIYRRTLNETFSSYNINEVLAAGREFSISTPDTTSVRKVCMEKGLDAILVTRIKFIRMTYTVYFVPVSNNWDTEVEMKLFDNTGALLLSVTHNTVKGNSYFAKPTADRTIHDGIEGALTRIAKELGLPKISE